MTQNFMFRKYFIFSVFRRHKDVTIHLIYRRYTQATKTTIKIYPSTIHARNKHTHIFRISQKYFITF